MNTVAFSLLSLLSAAAVLGFPTSSKDLPPQCVDPTFACQDIESARLCGTVKSCIHDIWSTLGAPEDNDEICDLCKEMVKEARDQLLSNMTQEEIKEVFEGSCKLLGIKVVVNACIKVVDEIIPELVEMLASRMDPTMVCTVSGLCIALHAPVTVQKSVQDELVCEFCTNVLEHIKELVTANTTMEEFRTALLNFCKHTGSFSDKCTELVNNYYDTIFGFIKNLDTKEFCTLIGLCNNQFASKEVFPAVEILPASHMRKVMPLVKMVPAQPVEDDPIYMQPMVKIEPAMVALKKVQDSARGIETNEIFESSQLPADQLAPLPLVTLQQNTDCAFCRAISFFLEKDLGNDRSEKAVDKSLKDVCEKWVFEYLDNCKAFLDHNIEIVRQHVLKGTEFSQICNSLKICPLEDTKNEINVKVVPPRNSDNICDLCKEAFDEIEKQLKDPATKSGIEDFLDQVCNFMPKTVQDDCRTFINKNVDLLFNVLEKELQGDTVCPALKLCPGDSKKLSGKMKSIECDLCKDFIAQLKQRLQDPDVKQSLKNLLDNGCSMLPGDLATECKNFVDQNIDNLINILVQDMDPNMVCSALNLCNGTAKKWKQQKLNDINCDICKEVIKELDDELKNPTTEEEIRKALDTVCSYLPSSLATKCEDFINSYANLIITLIAQEMDPTMVCAALNVCPEKLEDMEKRREKAEELECESCKYLFHYVQTQLMDSSVQKKIVAVVDKVCKLLPSEFSQNCLAYIEEYGDSILAIIAQKLDPSIVCYELDVCSKINKTVSKAYQLQKMKGFELDDCAICTSVVDYLDNLLENDSVDKEITSLIEKVCGILPSAYKQQCSVMVETYGPYILQMIGQLANSKEVCQDIDMCPRSAGHVHLLGGRKCTFGPSYWCQSQVHAAACKAESYCKQKVWEN